VENQREVIFYKNVRSDIFVENLNLLVLRLLFLYYLSLICFYITFPILLLYITSLYYFSILLLYITTIVSSDTPPLFPVQ